MGKTVLKARGARIVADAVKASKEPSAKVLAAVANANAGAGKAGIGHNNPPAEKPKVTSEQLATAGTLGWRMAGNDLAIAALWAEIAEVGEVKEVQKTFYRSYLARRAFPKAVNPSAKMLAEGERVRKMKGSDRDPETEFKWYEAARQAWSRLTRKAKVRPVGGLAGNSNATKTGKPSAAPKAVTVKQVLKAKTPPLPTAQNALDVNAFVEYEAKRMLRFINENAGTTEGAMKTAVADFMKIVKAIIAKKPEAKKAA